MLLIKSPANKKTCLFTCSKSHNKLPKWFPTLGKANTDVENQWLLIQKMIYIHVWLFHSFLYVYIRGINL
jgi:hypothetical protein